MGERLREVAILVRSQPTRDGAGVRLNRALGSHLLREFDPFLLLDEFRTDDPGDYIAGFPDHPHRGFETVTYMIHGAMEHRDSTGTEGRLGPGSAQWMTAGRGIIHSEMPQQERGLMWGFQLWVNLPARKKMIAPRYQDVPADRIPEVDGREFSVRVIAGTALGATGPVSGIDVEPLFLDLSLRPGGKFVQEVPETHSVLVYVTQGNVRLGPERRLVPEGTLAVLGAGNQFQATSEAGGGRALLVAGRPIGEPIARHGPFVMNTSEELRQAFDDFRTGRLATSH